MIYILLNVKKKSISSVSLPYGHTASNEIMLTESELRNTVSSGLLI